MNEYSGFIPAHEINHTTTEGQGCLPPPDLPLDVRPVVDTDDPRHTQYAGGFDSENDTERAGAVARPPVATSGLGSVAMDGAHEDESSEAGSESSGDGERQEGDEAEGPEPGVAGPPKPPTDNGNNIKYGGEESDEPEGPDDDHGEKLKPDPEVVRRIAEETNTDEETVHEWVDAAREAMRYMRAADDAEPVDEVTEASPNDTDDTREQALTGAHTNTLETDEADRIAGMDKNIAGKDVPINPSVVDEDAVQLDVAGQLEGDRPPAPEEYSTQQAEHAMNFDKPASPPPDFIKNPATPGIVEGVDEDPDAADASGDVFGPLSPNPMDDMLGDVINPPHTEGEEPVPQQNETADPDELPRRQAGQHEPPVVDETITGMSDETAQRILDKLSRERQESGALDTGNDLTFDEARQLVEEDINALGRPDVQNALGMQKELEEELRLLETADAQAHDESDDATLPRRTPSEPGDEFDAKSEEPGSHSGHDPTADPDVDRSNLEALQQGLEEADRQIAEEGITPPAWPNIAQPETQQEPGDESGEGPQDGPAS